MGDTDTMKSLTGPDSDQKEGFSGGEAEGKGSENACGGARTSKDRSPTKLKVLMEREVIIAIVSKPVI